MKKLLFVALIAVGLFAACSNPAPQPTHPSYEATVETLLDKVPATNPNQFAYSPQPTTYLSFAKRKEGWFLVQTDYNSGPKPNETETLFWSAKTGNFDLSAFPDLSDYERDRLERQFLTPNNTRNFAIHQYYGYKGWSKDIIDDYADYDEYSDTLLYGLARAYSDYASSLLYAKDTIGAPEAFLLEPDQSINADQIKTYKKYADLSIATFKNLIGQNADFETLLGTAKVNHDNQHLTAYGDLVTYGASQEDAAAYLVDGLYSPEIKLTAKNYLESCQPNAILFTGGDNDTYASWYLQQHEGIRNDVTVLNMSLLNIARYTDRVQSDIGNVASVSLSLPTEVYHDPTREVVMLSPENSQNPGIVLPAGAMISILGSRSAIRDYNGQQFAMLPTFNFVLPTDSTLKRSDFDPYASDTIPVSDVYAQMGRTTRLYKGQYIMLDILSTNNWERPVYYVAASNSFDHLGLDEYLHVEGLLLHLLPWKGMRQFGGNPVNVDMLEENLNQVYDASWTENWTTSKDKSAKRNLQHYRMRYVLLAMAQSANGNKEKALSTLKSGIDLVPAELESLEELAMFFGTGLMEAGDVEGGLQLLGPFAESQYKEALSAVERFDDLDQEEMYDLKNAMYALSNINNQLKVYAPEDPLADQVESWNGEVNIKYGQKANPGQPNVMPFTP